MVVSKRVSYVSLALVAGMLAWPPAVRSQNRWEWPEKPENLQVFPKDWPGKRLRPAMVGFTRALGVDCSYCHVGEKGEPLNTYDFASDDNPKKDVARSMLRMLDDINGHLEKIEPSGPAGGNMWCHTCHRGRPRPMTLAEEMLEEQDAAGSEAAISHYRSLRDEFYGRGAYDFGEGSLNQLGYQLLGRGDTESAIAIFKLNVEQYPESGNALDSLAEGYMKAGNRELAIEFYEKSLVKDPGSKNAEKQLKELRAAEREE